MDSHTPTMNWNTPDLATAFSLFKQRCKLYFQAKDIQGQDQVPILLLAVGEEGLQRFNSWRLTGEQKKDPEVIWTRFEEQLRPTENFRICRMKLRQYTQRPDESLDEFVNRCRLMALKCQFPEQELHEQVIMAVVASTPIPEFQNELLKKEKGFTIEQLLALGRTYEAAAAHSQAIRRLQPEGLSSSTSSDINVGAMSKECRYCGRSHAFNRDACPALRSKCSKCQKIGHWAIKCHAGVQKGRYDETRLRSRPRSKQRHWSRSSSRSRSRPRSRSRSVHRFKRPDRKSVHESHTVDDEVVESFESLTFNEMTGSSCRDEAYATLNIKLPRVPAQHKLRLKVDTGAPRNTLPLRLYREMFPDNIDKDGNPRSRTNSNTRLYTYNDQELKQYGTVTIPCQYKDSEWSDQVFFIVDVQGPGLLSLKASTTMGIVKLNCSVSVSSRPVINSVEDLKMSFPDQFDRVGCLPGKVHLVVDPDVPPHIDPPRKTPIALKDTIKKELDAMEQQGVIRKVTEPTEWVSSLVYSKKKDGSLRICLDPRHLNQALKRPHYKTPTLEELNHKFARSQYFSKLDAKAGYWSVQLDEESQPLTTFQTPFGRYCYVRLPFGLSVSQDIFQQRMDMVLEQCEGAEGIADDVVVHGETEELHDKNLIQLMSVAEKNGLVFNSSKCEIKKDQVTFFGNTYSREGIRPDPKKIADMQNMPAPTNEKELQEFLGLMNFFSPFIPNLAERSYLLRDLLKKENVFLWEPHHQVAFETLKSMVSMDCSLQYFDVSKDTVLQTDASMKGIGAALMQEHDGNLKPIAFASKALTSAETRYACIERELLAIVYGVQRFHTYLYGRRFLVMTDHKPLVMIVNKGIVCAPPRLQRLLLKLQGYDFEIRYQAGKDNTLADVLSRLPSDMDTKDVELDLRVDFIRFSDDRVKAIKEETANDPTLQGLKCTIVQGWPENIKDVPTPIRQYWSFRDELSVEDGVVMKGQRVVIPDSMKEDILEQLHYGHMGAEKTKLRAKDSVYWMNVNRDIDEMVKKCIPCQENQPNQQHETLMPHEVPAGAWNVIGTDIFHFEGDEYLIVADYYSKFPVVRKLPRPCPSATVVEITKTMFSELGLPDKVISDNGPHFASEQYKNFMKNWGILHVTSSPRYPRSNGFVERQIQTVKNVMKKAKRSNQDIQLALLCLRSTPIDHKLPSPAELLHGRKVRTTIPSKMANNRRDKEEIHDRLLHRQQVMKEIHDRNAKDLPPLCQGQKVTYQQQPDGPWIPATVIQADSQPRSYIISSPKGILRRNRVHIRDRHVRFAPESRDRENDSCTPVNQQEPNMDTEKSSVPTPVATEQIPHTTRSGRVVKAPKRYDD